jgi:hypothetical protein
VTPGHVSLVACDAKGERIPSGTILRISEDGIQRCHYVNPSLGLTLDDDAVRIVP